MALFILICTMETYSLTGGRNHYTMRIAQKRSMIFSDSEDDPYAVGL